MTKWRRIDGKSFTCAQCGHISTAPEAINYLHRAMTDFRVVPLQELPTSGAETTRITQLQSEHEGNSFSVQTLYKEDPADKTRSIPDRKVIKVAQSFAKVGFQDQTNLEDSDHIRLDCPQCNTVLYEVRW